jgi:hypothetical protein
MNTASQQRAETAHAGEALASQYHTMLDGWAELSKCCLAAADDIAQTGFEYVKDQVNQLHEIACNPSAAMREETFSNALGCSFDAADKITQAYLHSLEGVREPLMRVVTAQWPMNRTLAEAMGRTMQHGMEAMQRGAETLEKGAEHMEKSARGTARTMERGAEEAQHQGKRKSA